MDESSRGISIPWGDIRKLAANSGYFASIRERGWGNRLIHLLILPEEIRRPRDAFRVFYRYSLRLPLTRSQTNIPIEDFIYLCGYLQVPQGILRHIVTRFYIRPSRSVEALSDALHYCATLEYYDFVSFYLTLLGIPICIPLLTQPATREYAQCVMKCVLAAFQENYPRHRTAHLFPPITCPSALFCLSPGHNYVRQRIKLFCCTPRATRRCWCLV